MAYRKPRVIKVYGDSGTDKATTWPEGKVTGKQIKEFFKIPAGKLLIMNTPKGGKIIKDGDTVDVNEQGITLNVQPDVTQGAALESINYRSNKKARYLISQLLEYGEEKYRREHITIRVTSDLRYVLIPEFPMPDIWKQRRLSILIHIPDSYPDLPPVGFYLPATACLKTGRKHSHQYSSGFYGEQTLNSLGWDWFCLHLTNKSDWEPKDDPLKPHKLWNYIDIIRLGLTHNELRDVK